MYNEISSLVDAYRKRKSECGFIDSNCWLSFGEQRGNLYQVTGIGALAGELERHSISCALVSCTDCIEYDPITGNTRLIDSISAYENLFAAIVMVPEVGFGKGDAGRYLDSAIHSKAAAVRMFPRKLRHSLKKWQVGDILNCMQQRRVPLMLWHMETGWDMIDSICEEYPDLPVIIEGNDQKLLYHNRYYIPLLKKHENLYLETHNLINDLGIEYLVNEQNIERLVFGTYFPYNDPNSSMMMVTHADIDEKTRQKIAGGNIRMLIDNVIS